MLQAVGRKENDYLRVDEIKTFPSTDLLTIDRLWVKYSDGRFGFSVQKRIYVEAGNPLDGEYHKEEFCRFGDRVGWRVNNSWISYSEVTFSTSAPEGHLPALTPPRFVGSLFGSGLSFSSRTSACRL